MCLSSPGFLAIFQGNLGLVRVKVAFEIGRSLLKRTEQGFLYSGRENSMAKRSDLWKDTNVLARRMDIWPVKTSKALAEKVGEMKPVGECPALSVSPPSTAD